MTTIPNLNIVIQHGDAARETQQIRNQPLEAAQGTILKRIESDDNKRTVSQPLEEPDRLNVEKEKHQIGREPEKREKRERREARQGKKKRAVREPEKDAREPGRLVDTVV